MTSNLFIGIHPLRILQLFARWNITTFCPLTPAVPGGGACRRSLRFFKIAGKRRRYGFSPSLCQIFSETFVQILTLGHERSCHQVESRDPKSLNSYQTHISQLNVFKLLILNDVLYVTLNDVLCLVPTSCISRIFDIVDLRSGRFIDLSIRYK